MTDDATERGSELPPFNDDHATIAGLRALRTTRSQQPGSEHDQTSARTGPIYQVIVACAQCGTRQTFQGTVPEIGGEAEIWSRSHEHAAYGNDMPRRPH